MVETSFLISQRTDLT